MATAAAVPVNDPVNGFDSDTTDIYTSDADAAYTVRQQLEFPIDPSTSSPPLMHRSEQHMAATNRLDSVTFKPTMSAPYPAPFNTLTDRWTTFPAPRANATQATTPTAPTTTDRRSTSVSMSDVTSIVKPFNGLQPADKWLQQFQLYTTYKHIAGKEKIDLFRLLLTDTASDWLSTLSPPIVASEATLFAAFQNRFGMTQAQKWRTEKELWSRDQQDKETVDEYVTIMQVVANRVGMGPEQLLKLIIQGLKPELRLFVLNARVANIEELLSIARTCEAARQVDKPSHQSSIDVLTEVVGSLAVAVAELTSKSSTTTPVVQAPIQAAHPKETDWKTRKIYNPNNHRRQLQPRRQQQQQQHSGQWQPSQTPPQWNQPQYAAPINPPQWQQTPSSSQRSGTCCKFCGGGHQWGKQFCKAATARCRNCQRIGHFQSCCFRPPVSPQGDQQ